jgi:hypothetical protein
MQVKQQRGKLIVAVDVSERAILSRAAAARGKTVSMAFTNGFRDLGRVSFKLSVVVPNPYFGMKKCATSGGFKRRPG